MDWKTKESEEDSSNLSQWKNKKEKKDIVRGKRKDPVLSVSRPQLDAVGSSNSKGCLQIGSAVYPRTRSQSKKRR